ncbi:MAG: hypothetical protein WBM50_27810 [Acidimicrobiales bacterium]
MPTPESSDVSREAAPAGAPVGPALALAAAVVAIPIVIVLVILFALIPGPWWIGLLLGPLIAAGFVWRQFVSAEQLILSKLGDETRTADRAPRLENLVQSLSLAGGVEEPDIVVLNDDARNAMALRNRGRNRLVVTRGLLDSLEVVELEGLVAELLTRLKNGDAESATLGAALYGRPILDGPLSVLLHPVADLGLGRLLREDRDLLADREAVRLTRYPPGLLSALKTMGEGDVTPAANSQGLAHLWLVDPRSAQSAVEPTRAPLDLRIDVLAEL